MKRPPRAGLCQSSVQCSRTNGSHKSVQPVHALFVCTVTFGTLQSVAGRLAYFNCSAHAFSRCAYAQRHIPAQRFVNVCLSPKQDNGIVTQQHCAACTQLLWLSVRPDLKYANTEWRACTLDDVDGEWLVAEGSQQVSWLSKHEHLPQTRNQHDKDE